MYVAITGDIIGSTKLDTEQRDEVYSTVREDFNKLHSLKKFQFPFEFGRGDSFQGVLTEVKEALCVALLVKCIFRRNFGVSFSLIGKSKNANRKNWRIYNNLDARISVGLGDIKNLHSKLALSDGTALQLSGRSLAKMKQKGQKLLIVTGNEALNRELEVELRLLDAIIEKWTPMSAEVVYYLLLGKNETETSQLLNISQSAINQRKKTASWDAIELLLENYKYQIENKL